MNRFFHVVGRAIIGTCSILVGLCALYLLSLWIGSTIFELWPPVPSLFITTFDKVATGAGVLTGFFMLVWAGYLTGDSLIERIDVWIES